ncbi:MAG TPA: HK97 gp10 family phage protein [Polyangiaceae bacterium]|nr:HK97 gp10 family phage protein [Polyangiaceae bacterium]
MTTKRVTVEEFARILDELPDEFTAAATRGLRSAAQVLEGFAVDEIRSAEPHPAVATGELARSVVTTRVDDGAIVRVEAPHAPFMEEGTRPHFPPLQPLEDWVRLKGFARDDASVRRIAYAIALKISRDGIAPRHFFQKAVRRMNDQHIVPREIARELDRIAG